MGIKIVSFVKIVLVSFFRHYTVLSYITTKIEAVLDSSIAVPSSWNWLPYECNLILMKRKVHRPWSFELPRFGTCT